MTTEASADPTQSDSGSSPVADPPLDVEHTEPVAYLELTPHQLIEFSF